MQAYEVDILEFVCLLYEMRHLLEVYAKLVFGKSGGYILMGVGIDVGVDAQSYIGGLAKRCGKLVDDFEFGLRLDIETSYAILESEDNLGISLADSGINYLRAFESCVESCLNLSAAHCVDSKSGRLHMTKNAGIGIGLHGIVHFEAFVA